MQTAKKRRRLPKLQMAMSVCIIILSAYGFQTAYSEAAENVCSGNDARAKYENQTARGRCLLLGGRNEILSSGQAILDSPVIGHGSWHGMQVFIVVARALVRTWIQERLRQWDELIPTHSYIFGAWVEAGILGAVFLGLDIMVGR